MEHLGTVLDRVELVVMVSKV